MALNLRVGPAQATQEFAAAVGESDPVAVVGGGTRGDVGGAVDPAARLVTAPTGILEFEPAEMTVRVLAGTPLAELDAELAAADQYANIGGGGAGSTVGGALAVGWSDIRRLGRGPMRDALLQVRYVSADGRVISGGGPVVKNVSSR